MHFGGSVMVFLEYARTDIGAERLKNICLGVEKCRCAVLCSRLIAKFPRGVSGSGLIRGEGGIRRKTSGFGCGRGTIVLVFA